LAGPLAAAGVFLLDALIFMRAGRLAGQPAYAWSHLPLDDAWIHLSYAKNLLHHGYFTYNPGTVETGATSPLWVFVLALALGVLRAPVLAAKVAGLACAAACVAATHHELRRLGGRTAAWTGALLLALDPAWVMAACSGMEVPLAGLMLILLVGQVRRRRPGGAGVIMGLLILTRPEGVLAAGMAGVLLALGLWRNRKPGATAAPPGRPLRGWRSLWTSASPSAVGILGSLLLCGAVAAAVAGPWFLYCRLGTGFWLPSTFYVKAVVRAQGVGQVFWSFLMMLDHGYWPSPLVHDPVALALLAAGCGFALVRLRRGEPTALALPGMILIHLAGWAMVNPFAGPRTHPGEYLNFNFDRYYLADYPLVFALAALGAGVLARGLGALGRRLRTDLAPRPDRVLRRALALAVLLLLVAGNFFGWWTAMGPLWSWGEGWWFRWNQAASLNQDCCRNIYEIQERTGQWVAAHVAPNVPLAIQDAGAIRYYTTNPIVDLWGLNSHAYLHTAEREKFLRRTGVRLAIIFPKGRLEAVVQPFKTRRLMSFTTFPNMISEGAGMDVLEILP